MLKIAFCDDDPAVLEELRSLLEQYGKARGLELSCTPFQSPLELLAELERGIRYDALFLDILMPGENGMEAAAEIRALDRNVKLIFLSSSAEYAVRSYDVDAFYYQLKPVSREDLFRLMDAVAAACEQDRADSLILRCKTGIHRIELRQLEYCRVVHRTLYLHLRDGRALESSGSLDELAGQLSSRPGFLRHHRSYLINLDHVSRLSFRAVTMSCGDEIPIPRGKYNDVKSAFLDHAFQKRQPIL